MTARAARLEQGVPVTLRWIGFFGLLSGPVSQHGVASVAATLPQSKGQRGCGLGEAWWKIEVFHSTKTMLRRPHEAVAERGFPEVV